MVTSKKYIKKFGFMVEMRSGRCMAVQDVKMSGNEAKLLLKGGSEIRITKTGIKRLKRYEM